MNKTILKLRQYKLLPTVFQLEYKAKKEQLNYAKCSNVHAHPFPLTLTSTVPVPRHARTITKKDLLSLSLSIFPPKN